MHLKHRAAVSELEAVAWLLRQGYEVFRNVSAHGPIDVIAIRADERLYLDIRTASKIGVANRRLTEEQAGLGVKFLVYLPDGSFEFAEARPPIIESVCPECGKSFHQWRGTQVWCSRRCCDRAGSRRYLKKHGLVNHSRRERARVAGGLTKGG